MIGIYIGLGILGLVVLCMVAWYRVVPQSQAHNVVVPNSEDFVASPDKNVATKGRKSYFAIPSFIPFFGRIVRVMDITVKEITGTMETYESGQARYNVDYSLKYRVKDVETAAQKFSTDKDLTAQLVEVVQSSVRAVTVKHDVTDARGKKKEMSDAIEQEMDGDLKAWGLEMVNFQLVDFKDTEESKIISDISRRREVEISSRTRQENASREKEARMKEAESDEAAQKREIERDRQVAIEKEMQKQKVAEQQKIAEEERYKVVKVQQIEQANIDKAQAEIEAEKSKRVSQLLGEGEQLRLEATAKGKAAEIREKGLAEAEAKEKLQQALNKFGDSAIRALVAEKVVDKDKEVGIATAKALEFADIKVLSGGDNKGFDLAGLMESMSVVDPNNKTAIQNRLARPNDMGLSALGLKELSEKVTKKKSKLDTVKTKPTTTSVN